MKKHILNLGFTSFLVACGGSSDSLKNKELEPLSQTQTLERVEALRATEVMGKKAEELHIEKRVKFYSYSGLKILLKKILNKLYQTLRPSSSLLLS